MANVLNKKEDCKTEPKVVIIRSGRTPFFRKSTRINDDVLKMTSESIFFFCQKFQIEPHSIDYFILGNAVQDFKHTNIARDSISFINDFCDTPGHSINAACLSSLLAATSSYDMIKGGTYSNVLSGGVDFLSCVSFRLNKKSRRLFVALSDPMPLYEFVIRSMYHLKDLFRFEIPQFKDFVTKKSMIEECIDLALTHKITPEEAQDYTLKSFRRAFDAREKNHLNTIIEVNDDYNLIKGDQNLDKFEALLKNSYPLTTYAKKGFNDVLAQLNLVNSKKAPIHTFSTMSFSCSRPYDGISLTHLSSEEFAQKNNLKPLATIKDYCTVSHDPKHEFLMTPAYAIPQLLIKNNLRFEDVDVFEIHEAFAAQVLVLLKYLNDKKFLEANFGIPNGLGTLTVDEINKWGGTLAFGHPLGATGSRLINMAADQLVEGNKRYAVVCACSTGAQAVAILLERENTN